MVCLGEEGGEVEADGVEGGGGEFMGVDENLRWSAGVAGRRIVRAHLAVDFEDGGFGECGAGVGVRAFGHEADGFPFRRRGEGGEVGLERGGEGGGGEEDAEGCADGGGEDAGVEAGVEGTFVLVEFPVGALAFL